MEAILGLVYITSGYECCEQVAHELGFLVESPSLPRHMSYAQQAESTKEASLPCLSRKDLLNLVRDCLGGYSFQSPILVEEAFTHGSAVYESVSSYQRLEWIGDATLCIAAREYLFREFPGRQVGDLVTLEAAFVSNETLAFHCVSKKLHRFINHRDQSLPSRLENYEWTLKEQSRGLWSTGRKTELCSFTARPLLTF
jgi:endoribonuclease Dicer